MPDSFKVVREDSKILSRAGILSVGSGVVTTPARALHLSHPVHLCESLRVRNPNVQTLHETYSRINRSLLRSLNGDVGKQGEYVKRQYSLLRKLSEQFPEGKHIVIHFSEFVGDAESVEIPDEKETQYLIDLMDLPGVSAISVPAINGVPGGEYLSFVKTFLKLIETRRPKKIVGLIPYLAYHELDPLITFYLDEGVRSFAVDLHGRNPIASWPNVRFAISTLRREARVAGEDIFVHALNTGCRSTPRQDVRPATDMLCIMAGFDSFGRSHVTPKVTADLVGPLRKSSEEALRLFNRGDYGYHKLRDAESVRFPKEENATTTLEDITRASEYRLKMAAKNWFNAERQGIESNLVNRILNEEDGSVGDHLGSKAFVDGRIRKILSKIRDGMAGASSLSLDKFR